jgi:hypothetical protein
MKYDGVVIRIDDLFLFILNPETNKLMDGINISEHECYKELNDEQLMVVDVSIKDGTEEIEDVDLEEFIYGDSYNRLDTFIYIHDVMLLSFSDNNSKDKIFIKQIIDNGDLNDVAIESIQNSKNKNENEVFKEI